MVTYQRQPLAKNQLFFFTRRLPADSRVEVKVADVTQPETIVFHAWKKLGFRVFDLSELFGVEAEKVGEMLAKPIGSRVYPGDILASSKQWWGLREKVFRSPIAGVVMDFDTKNAKLTLQYLPEEQKVTAGVYGKVVRVLPGEKFTIGTRAHIINGVTSFGVRREGSLVEVGYPDIPIQSDQILSKHANKIIFGGVRIGLNAVYKALSMGVQAVVTGGMDYEDFLHLTGSRGRMEDIGISLFLTEGFGSLPIYPTIYGFLKESEHRHIFVLPRKDRLVIPVSGEAFDVQDVPNQIASLGRRDTSVKGNFGLLKEGSKVRLLSGDRFGKYGIVSDVNEDGTVQVSFKDADMTVETGEIEIIRED